MNFVKDKKNPLSLDDTFLSDTFERMSNCRQVITLNRLRKWKVMFMTPNNNIHRKTKIQNKWVQGLNLSRYLQLISRVCKQLWQFQYISTQQLELVLLGMVNSQKYHLDFHISFIVSLMFSYYVLYNKNIHIVNDHVAIFTAIFKLGIHLKIDIVLL